MRECSKESIVQYMYENSAWTRRFSKKSVKDRQKRLKYKRNAQKNQQELNNEITDVAKKKKKKFTPKQTPVNKQ